MPGPLIQLPPRSQQPSRRAPLAGLAGRGDAHWAGRTGCAFGETLREALGPGPLPHLPRHGQRRELTGPGAADRAGVARPSGRLERGRWARVSLEGGRRGVMGAPRLLTARTLYFPLCFLFTCNRKNNRSSRCLICSPALPTSPPHPVFGWRVSPHVPLEAAPCPSSKQLFLHIYI